MVNKWVLRASSAAFAIMAFSLSLLAGASAVYVEHTPQSLEAASR